MAMPRGAFNSAGSPVPAKVLMTPAGVTMRMRLLEVSAIYQLPPESTTTPEGEIQLRGRGRSAIAAEIGRRSASGDGGDNARARNLQYERARSDVDIAGSIQRHIPGRCDAGNLLNDSAEVIGRRDVEDAIGIESDASGRGRVEHGDDVAVVHFSNAVVGAVRDSRARRSGRLRARRGRSIARAKRTCRRQRIPLSPCLPPAIVCRWSGRDRPDWRRNRKCRATRRGR